MASILKRKIITASIAGSLYAILLGIFMPNPFGGEMQSVIDYFYLVSTATPVYLMYSFPAIIIYGVIASVMSEKIAQFITKKIGKDSYEFIISGILHLLFGLVLHIFSLIAALLFFVTDRWLQRKKLEHNWSQALKSLVLPLCVWVFFMGIVYIEHIITDV